MSYFEEDADGKLSPSGQISASSNRSENRDQRVKTLRSAILLVNKQYNLSQLIVDQMKTRWNDSESNLLEIMSRDDSITNLKFNFN